MVTKVKGQVSKPTATRWRQIFVFFPVYNSKKCWEVVTRVFYFILFCVLFRSDCSRMSSGSKYSFTHTEVREATL